jgi:hypothetical protein
MPGPRLSSLPQQHTEEYLNPPPPRFPLQHRRACIDRLTEQQAVALEELESLVHGASGAGEGGVRGAEVQAAQLGVPAAEEMQSQGGIGQQGANGAEEVGNGEEAGTAGQESTSGELAHVSAAALPAEEVGEEAGTAGQESTSGELAHVSPAALPAEGFVVAAGDSGSKEEEKESGPEGAGTPATHIVDPAVRQHTMKVCKYACGVS